MLVRVVVGRLGPGSGTGGQAWLLARGLVARGHTVVVSCRSADAVPAGVEVEVGRRPGGRPGEVRLALDRVPGCDVVRASGGVHRAWAPRSWRWRDLREAARDRAAIRTARVVVCNSRRAAGEVVAWHGVPQAQLRVVRNGVDLVRLRPSPRRPQRGRTALFLGTGWRRKGLDAAIAAFREAAGPADRLVVLGRDARPGRWIPAARRQLGDQLEVVPACDPVPWLAQADALLHPTRYDASANAVLEAMACGIPPVTTACDGAAEIVPDRRLVVGNPRDVAGLARALRVAWEGGSRLGALCRDAAEAWPDTRMVGAMEQILEECGHG